MSFLSSTHRVGFDTGIQDTEIGMSAEIVYPVFRLRGRDVILQQFRPGCALQ